jgi:plasmid stabilization system protein ParE
LGNGQAPYRSQNWQEELKINILDLAEADLLRGFNFYEAQTPGVGHYFLDTLYSEIDSLCLYAGIHPIRFGCFRMLSRRFPFAVYYKLDRDEVSVLRVIDCRQDPGWIRKQVESPE